MRKLRILVLMHKELVPPEDAAQYDVVHSDWRTEFDVMKGLRKLGHEVHLLGMGDELRGIRDAISEWDPHIVFNLLEDFHGVPIFDQNVVAYLELLRIPYTGCNPRGLLLARDKALSKEVLAYHRIPVPTFSVFRMGQAVRRPKRLAFPVIVKSLTKEASAGISQASVVADDDKLKDRVKFIHQSVGTDAIVERYIPGRELYVGVMGNQRLQVFPIWEMFFDEMQGAAWPIATDRAKWSHGYQIKHGIATGEADDLSDETAARIQHVCRRVYRTLGLSGYARMDLRLDPDDNVYVLEANPNPQLADGEDLASSAQVAGLEYGALLQRIISLGLRWRPDRSR